MRIEVRDISYTYSRGTPYETEAVRNVSFSISQGEFVAVIGCTGSGKSTLLQHLNGLLAPSSGSVSVDGIDPASRSAEARKIRHKIGMIFQYPEHQLFEESVVKDVSFGPKNLGFPETEAGKMAEEALFTVGIPEDLFLTSPFSLSGGEKRRVAIAGVLAMRPEVIAMDEPAAGLDPKGRRDLMEMIKRLNEDEGKTIVLVSHNMDDVAEYARRVLVMDEGKLVMDAAPAEIFSRSSELSSLGLDLPSATILMDMLHRKGFPRVPAITESEAVDAIEKILRGGVRWP